MGREIKRVPSGFAAPIKEVWFGYVLDAIPCQLCGGTGERPQGSTVVRWGDEEGQTYTATYCELCEGEGKVNPQIEVPRGDAYQMWETTSEGSPISPAFDAPQELARWLADNNASAWGSSGASYEQWMNMIDRGYAPTMVMRSHGDGTGTIQSGVAALADDRK